VQKRPDKAAQFARYRYNRDLAADPPLHQAPEAPMEPSLRFPAELPDPRRLMLLALTQLLAHLRRQSVMLRTLDQKPARMRVAALGDGALMTRVARARFAADQTKISHELPWMVKAASIRKGQL